MKKNNTFEFTTKELKTGLPFIGSLIYFAKDPLKFIAELVHHQPGPIAQTKFLSRKVFVLTESKAIEHVLVTHNRNYLRSPFMTPVKFILGTGLLTSEGKTWARQRSISHETFYHKNLDTYISIINEEANLTVSSIKKKIQANTFFDFSLDSMDLTFAVISRSLFTIKNEDTNAKVRYAMDELLQYIEWYNLSPIKWPLWMPFIRKNKIFKREHLFLKNLADEMITIHQENLDKYDDLLTKLLTVKDKETNLNLPREEIRDQVLTFLLAGHETTAIAISWIVYHLAIYPEYARKVHEEIDNVNIDELKTFTELTKLKYTRQFIWESMRLRPPTWSIDRTAGEDDEILGIKIPKGSIIMIPAYVIHRHSKHWSDPLIFNPSRFDARDNDANDFTFLPFGGGTRACVARNFALMETILIIAKLAKNFNFEASSIPFVEGKAFITYRPKYGMWVKAKVRA